MGKRKSSGGDKTPKKPAIAQDGGSFREAGVVYEARVAVNLVNSWMSWPQFILCFHCIQNRVVQIRSNNIKSELQWLELFLRKDILDNYKTLPDYLSTRFAKEVLHCYIGTLDEVFSF